MAATQPSADSAKPMEIDDDNAVNAPGRVDSAHPPKDKPGGSGQAGSVVEETLQSQKADTESWIDENSAHKTDKILIENTPSSASMTKELEKLIRKGRNSTRDVDRSTRSKIRFMIQTSKDYTKNTGLIDQVMETSANTPGIRWVNWCNETLSEPNAKSLPYQTVNSI